MIFYILVTGSDMVAHVHCRTARQLVWIFFFFGIIMRDDLREI